MRSPVETAVWNWTVPAPVPRLQLPTGNPSMPNIALSDARVKALRPRPSACDIRDTKLRGFGVRVLPSGAKRFFIHIQHRGTRVWKIVGDANDMTLADAPGGGDRGFAEAPARREMRRYRDSVKRIEPPLGLEVHSAFWFSGARSIEARQLERPMGHTSVQAFRRDPQPNQAALARDRLSHGDARWIASRRTRDLRTSRLRLWDSRKSPESAAVVEGALGARVRHR